MFDMVQDYPPGAVAAVSSCRCIDTSARTLDNPKSLLFGEEGRGGWNKMATVGNQSASGGEGGYRGYREDSDGLSDSGGGRGGILIHS